jgi:redox-sensing transcriptional repressor
VAFRVGGPERIRKSALRAAVVGLLSSFVFCPFSRFDLASLGDLPHFRGTGHSAALNSVFWIFGSLFGSILARVNGSIPAATVARLPIYLRCLGDLTPDQETCSSEELAAIAGVNSAQVRKDLSYLGSQGVRGVGYNVVELGAELQRALGLTKGYPVAIVGIGNLGRALSNYGGFEGWGFNVVALFDADPGKVGTEIGGLTINAMDDLERVVKDRNVAIGIVATPAAAAQEVADRFLGAGLRSILNFAPTVLQVPDTIAVRRVDLSTELQILTFYMQDSA